MIPNVRCAGNPPRIESIGRDALVTIPPTRPCGWSGKRMTSHGVILNLHLPCKNCGGAVEEIVYEERQERSRSGAGEQ